MRGNKTVGRLGGWVVVALLCGATSLSASQESARPPVRPSAPRVAEPGSSLRISIRTMGPGADVWERFGHNAIVVEDQANGSRTAYNYGMFSFRQENFILRFIQGRMHYWMAGFPAEEDLARYVAGGRWVREQELNLTPAQRVELRDFLEWNVRPENRFYRYDYFLDNCSTRVRDAIDHVIGGALHAQNLAPASGTFRFHTQRLVDNSLSLYTGLLLALGARVDRPQTRWDEMFLPFKLREYLGSATITDSTGTTIPLVLHEQTLFESDRYPVPEVPPDWWPGYLATGLLLGGLLWWGGAAGRARAAARRTLLLLGTCWALLTGVGGAILAGLWALTDHVAAASNENVLQCSLLALALAFVLPSALRDRNGPQRAARMLAMLVAGLSLLGVVLKVLPMFHQVNGQVLALIVPANLGLALGVLSWTRGNGQSTFG